MDWTSFGLSSLAVFALMFVVGFCISLVSSTMQCGKTNLSESALEGLEWGAVPSAVYILA